MPTRNVSLTDHYEGFIDRNVSSGQFNNASEVVRAGLQLLEQRQREGEARIAALREAAKVGFDDLEQGRYIDFASDDELNAHLDQLGQVARARVGSRGAA